MPNPENPKAVVFQFYKLALVKFNPKEAFEKYANSRFRRTQRRYRGRNPAGGDRFSRGSNSKVS